MRNIKIAATQMPCTWNRQATLDKADHLVREAAQKGANIILLQELFETPYFCQLQKFRYMELATTLEENPAVEHFKKLAKELDVVLPISFFERAGNTQFNSIAIIDADGEILGVYRKTHIPDGLPYAEKFYFTPGDTGFKVWNTKYGRIGVGICWDQWFPETARCMALQGAELLFYPTAIGSEPLLGMDSSGHWERCMQGHAAANLMPVIAANRIGTETVEPCEANQNQQSELTFYGTSFITDQTGAVLEQAGRTEDTDLLHTFDLDAIQKGRLEWGLFRDRRPEQYGAISSPIPVQI